MTIAADLRLHDALVAHQVRALRLAAGHSRAVNVILRQLLAKLEPLTAQYREPGMAEATLALIRELTRAAYVEATRLVRGALLAFGRYEAEWSTHLLSTTLGVRLASVPGERIVAALAQPFMGSTIDEWFTALAARAYEQARRVVRIGALEGETVGVMTTALRRMSELDRRHAEAVVRTLTNGVAVSARQLTLDEHADLFAGVRWVSTLDSRTTPICQERDGEVYPLDSGPRPPAHVNCRSTITPVLRVAPTPTGTRAAAGGPVSATTTYPEWLRRQSRAVQEEVLGRQRAALFRAGKLPLERFIDDAGRYYTLAEMRRREASTWDRVFGE